MPSLDVLEKVVVDASLDQIRPLVREFRQWEHWSPWLSAEPECRLTYRQDGLGYAWEGRIIGSGMMDLRSETAHELVYELQFLKPWKSTSQVSFTFVPQGASTEVSWRMNGNLPLLMYPWLSKMKAWIGGDYQRGLARLKDYAESGKVPSKLEFKGVGEGLVSSYVGISACSLLGKISQDYAKQYTQIHSFISEADLAMNGPPLTIYHKFDIVKGSVNYTAAIPVKGPPPKVPAGLVSGTIDAPSTYCIEHIGAYRHLGSAWSAGITHQRNKLFRSSKKVAPFEWYRSDPEQVTEADLVTEVHFPVV